MCEVCEDYRARRHGLTGQGQIPLDAKTTRLKDRDGYQGLDRAEPTGLCADPAEIYGNYAKRPISTEEMREREASSIRDLFAYHVPNKNTLPKYRLLRTDFTNLAIRIAELIPDSQHRSIAIENLHVAMMLTNRAVALGGD